MSGRSGEVKMTGFYSITNSAFSAYETKTLLDVKGSGELEMLEYGISGSGGDAVAIAIYVDGYGFWLPRQDAGTTEAGPPKMKVSELYSPIKTPFFSVRAYDLTNYWFKVTLNLPIKFSSSLKIQFFETVGKTPTITANAKVNFHRKVG